MKNLLFMKITNNELATGLNLNALIPIKRQEIGKQTKYKLFVKILKTANEALTLNNTTPKSIYFAGFQRHLKSM